ncbi:MAG: DUF455 domain-containing protein, partial [Bordetella sp.]|nr:DUF455 domain-containing protein [Pseudomonadota bacterium]
MHPRLRALHALRLADPEEKVAATRALAAQAAKESLADETWCEPVRDAADEPGVPGRPARPVRVSATEVPTRSPFTDEGRAALVHSIC